MRRQCACAVMLISMIWAFNLSPLANAELIGHWKFDGDLTDSVGTNDGTANGDVFAGTDNGLFGGAAEFDGSGDSIVIPSPSLPGITWSLTWWSFSPAESTNTGYMVASGDPSGYEAFFFRRYGPEVYAGGVTQDTNVTPRISLGEPGPYPRGIWHHHAVLHDGATSTAYWYIDGQLWIDTNAADTNKTTFTSFDEVIYVGNRKSGGRDFEGKIDDLRIYDHVLREEEIERVMEGISGGYPFASGPNPPDGALHEDTWINLSWRPGDYAVSHDVYLGDNFDDVNNGTEGTFRINQTTTFYVAGFAGFAYPDGLVPGTTYYWRIDEVNEADPNSPWKGPVWSFSIPPKTAYAPVPTDGTEFVDLDIELTWTPGFGAILHTIYDIYFGADKEAVENATTDSPEYRGNKPLGSESFDPGPLDWLSNYYWRVDAVYSAKIVKGLVWSFTVADFLLVDDFESYTDDDAAGQAIWQHWIDGFGVADNGAQVGYLLPPYGEQTIIHSGSQSMPLLYDNTNGVTNSEAILTLTSPRDWTAEDVKQLSLWFRGRSANAAEPLYVAIANTSGAPAIMAYNNPNAAQTGAWTQWTIPLQSFADQAINLTNVDKLAIGLGTKSGVTGPGGTGTIYIDDIRLYR